MKTRVFPFLLVSFGLLAIAAQGQVTTSTAFTNNAGFNEPYNVVEDAANNIYFTDSGNQRIVRVDHATQAVTTLAGLPGMPGFVNGANNVAQFNDPQGLLLVTLGGTSGLLVADSGNDAIRFVRLSDGYVSTLAGNGSPGSDNNAAGTNATFHTPLGMDQDKQGNIYIADSANNAVRVLNLNDPAFGVTNLQVTGAAFWRPAAIAFVATNQIWVADAGANPADNTIKLFALTNAAAGSLVSFIGGNSVHVAGGYVDSVTGANARFNGPFGLLWLNGVGLLISDSANHVIRLATNNPAYGATNYSVTTYAGNGTAGLVNGGGSASEFNTPYGLAPDLANNAFLVGDSGNNVIRRVLTGVTLPISTPPVFNNPDGLAVDSVAGSLYLADFGNNVVRSLNLNNNQTTIFLAASNGISQPVAVLVDTNENLYVLNQNGGANGNILEFDRFGNFEGTNASGLVLPTAFTQDGAGNLFVAEQSGATLALRAGVSNTIATITNAHVSLQGIAVFDDGTLAVSDAGNHVVWSVNPLSKAVSLLTGQVGNFGSTLGASNFALLYQPHQLTRAGNNQLVVADTGNNRLVTVGRNGAITNVLNTTNALLWFGRSNDPVANTNSAFVPILSPMGVAVSSAGVVYDSETYYGDIRGLTVPVAAPAPVSVTLPLFNGPNGLAFDGIGNNLWLADQANNAIEQLNLSDNLTTTFLQASNGISQPVSVLVDTNENLYVLNQNGGANGNILKFDRFGNLLGTNSANLNWPAAFTQDGYGNLFVAEQSGAILALGAGVSNTIAVITNANVSLQGIAIFDDGTIAVSDAGNHVVWAVNPITKVVSLLTGQVGIHGSTLGASNFALLNQPRQLARAGGNALVIADSGNNRLVTLARSGAVTNVLNAANADVWFGQAGDPVASGNVKFVPMIAPAGVTVGNGVVFASETYYKDIRGLLGTGLALPAVSPFDVLPFFTAPSGIAFDASGNSLFIAEPTRNSVEKLDLNNNLTTHFLAATNGISQPVAVVVDTNANIYVLNQNAGTNGNILEFDRFGNRLGTNAASLNWPTALTRDGYGNLFVAEQSGAILALSAGVSNTLAIITNANVSLQGIAIFDDGTLAVSDAGDDVVWSVNPITKAVSLLTGQLGNPGTTLGASEFALLTQPRQLVRAGNNLLIVADTGNNRLVTLGRDGSVTNVLNPANADIWFGLPGDPVTASSPQFIPMISPSGVAVGNGEVFASETYYDDIRGLLGSGVTYPAANTGVPLPVYSSPAGIALNSLGTILFVADPINDTVSALDLTLNDTTVFLNASNGIYQPVDVGVDTSDNIYVLNQGTGGNGSVEEFDKYGNFLGTNAISLSMPTAMHLDFNANIFVTEQNGLVQEFNAGGSKTLANITNANVNLQGIAILDNGSVVVSDAGNQVVWQIAPGATNAGVFAGIVGTNGTTFGALGYARLNRPMRLAQASGGLLLIADSGNNRVVVANDLGTVSSALDATNAQLWFGSPIDPVSSASPNFVPMQSPVGLAIGSGGTVYDSESVYKVIRGMLATGIQTATPPPPAPQNLVATPGEALVTLTWSTATGATNYFVERTTSTNSTFSEVAATTTTSYRDTNVIGGSTYYYEVFAVNSGGQGPPSASVSATPLIPPPPAPEIGWFDYEPETIGGVGGLYTVLHPVSIATFNNDQLLAIDPETTGDSTYYTTDGSTPSRTNGTTATIYQNGLGFAQPLPVTPTPVLTIEAVNIDSIDQVSPITTAEFQFQVANPTITGNNAGQFTVSDITTNTQIYYTVDGSDPVNVTNGTTSSGPVTLNSGNSATISLQITSNTLFRVRGYRVGYSPSGIAEQSFSVSNYVANIISLGFASGDASSAFIASPGQTFYAPVTLSVLPNTEIYSLQFDVTVTNAGPTILTTTVTNTSITETNFSSATTSNSPPATGTNIGIFSFTTTTTTTTSTNIPGNNAVTVTNIVIVTNTVTTIITNVAAATTTVSTNVSTTISTTVSTTVTNLPNPGPTITPGAFGFQSMLEKPDLSHPGFYIPIPPYMFVNDDTNVLNPSQIVTYEGTNFINLLTTDTALNLLGVGWLEIYGYTNLYITQSQDLIQYSDAHLDFRQQASGQVILGGYTFTVPASAVSNQTYQLQISRATATSDGIGANGSDVYIAAPTNGSFFGGAPINALEYVTIGQIRYLVGSVYPFRWFNAGDFGSTNIVDADVEQVFESAIYNINDPPAGSDLLDAMDSCGNLGYLDTDPKDPNFNFYTNANLSLTQPQQTGALLSGDDTTINQVVFGDGVLDVCDVYVTYRRSLDPSLTWFRRFWNNGQRVADTGAANVAGHVTQAPASPKALNTSTVAPLVDFAAGDIVGSAGQTVSVPINATIVGSYPLRVLMLNLSVVPLDGSPALTVPVTFNQIATTLGTPYTTTSQGNGNFAAVWLDSSNDGLTGTVTLGTLSVTIPATAAGTAAYAIHFDHASASPNGIGSFSNTKQTGLLTTTPRTNSYYGDGIPDSWRLRWFGTIYNVLSQSNACPSGDGVPNWKKYIAGVDPNLSNDFPSTTPKTPVPAGSTTAITWPSVPNKQYVIMRANSLYGSSWSVLSTNTGTGGTMEFDDVSTAKATFYRVEILP